MAQKEIKFKITVEGKELEITSDQLEKLNKEAKSARDELDKVGEAVTEVGDAAVESSEEVKSLGEQIGKVEDKMGELILAGKQNTKEFKDLQQESRKLKSAQEEMQIASQRTLDTFAAMPGPIGLIGKTFKDLSTTAKLARTGLQSMGLGFDTLKKSLVSSGVGAIVILFGLLATAVIKALGSFKPLQSAMDRFKVLFEVLGKVIEPVVDLIGTALVKALDLLAYGLAFVTGSLDEYNKALADQAAADKAIKANEKLKREFELTGDKLSEVEQKITQAKIAAADKRKEINEDEKLSEAEKARYIKLVNERLARDIQKINDENAQKQKEAEDKKKEERKKAYEEYQAREKDFQGRLLTLQNEYALLSISDDFEKQRVTLEQQKTAFEKEVSELKVTQAKKKQLLDQYNANYLLKVQEIEDKKTEYEKTKEKEKQDILKQIKEAEINTEAELRQKALDDTAEFYDKAIALAEQYGVDTFELEKSKLEKLAELNQKFIDEDKKAKEDADQAERDALAANVEYRQSINLAIADAAMNLASVLQSVAGENKALLKTAIIIEKAASIAQIVAQTAIANAKAVALAPQFGGQPWVTINTISAGISIAGVIAAAAKGLSEIGSGGSGGSNGGGAPQGQNLGRNYEKGGLIGGRRHAQGGTLIEAEAGEAILNRNSVAMFGPLLSKMNQMGGGVSFSSNVSQPSYDNPKTSNYGQSTEGSIIKTYVVEQDLTTAQQRQARLKDLSVL